MDIAMPHEILVQSKPGPELRVRRLFEGGGMRVREALFAPEATLPAHDHGHGYLCFVLGGAFAERSGRNETYATAGAVYYLPAGATHTNRFSRRGAHCLRIEIDPSATSLLGPDREAFEEPWFQSGGPRSWMSLQLYHRAIEGCLGEDELTSYLAGMLPGERNAKPRKTGKRNSPSWLQRVRESLDDSIGSMPSLEELSRLANVHRSHLTRAFVARYGCSIGEYVQTRRITEACRLLVQEGGPSLSRIALDLGYHDQAHFTRAFRRRVGRPPGAYRIADRGEPGTI
jgi:AraC family transcriptional regulator